MLVREIDLDDPWIAARRLADLPGMIFLDSAMRPERLGAHASLGRWSYVAADPFGRFEVRGGRPFWNDEALDAAPLEALRGRLRAFARPRDPRLPPFAGGAVGFVAYDFGRILERLPPPRRPEPVPDMAFGFYDVVVAFDHLERRAMVVSSGCPESADGPRAAARLDDVLARLSRREPKLAPVPPLDFRPGVTRAAHEAAVAAAIEHVLAGDVFQVNIAQRFAAPLTQGFDPLAFHGLLRRTNPAPFAAFLDLSGVTISSSSPERFLELRARRVETRPIKGTTPRGADPEADALAAARLAGSEKDRAENVMIVDLMRNDLSRVCEDDSIEVPVLCGVETYAGLHHLVSVVTGRLAEGRDGLDLLAAAFPGGSITGAPKIRAEEIIAELEEHGRGVYCGSIGWIGFDGDMDLDIAIRTVVFRDGEAVVSVGGGITALSDPAAEYDETLTKAARIFAAAEGQGPAAPEVAS